jgi:hypothetical protein
MPAPVRLTTLTFDQGQITQALRRRVGEARAERQEQLERLENRAESRVSVERGAINLLGGDAVNVGMGTVDAIKEEVRGDPLRSLKAATRHISRDNISVLLAGGPVPIETG